MCNQRQFKQSVIFIIEPSYSTVKKVALALIILSSLLVSASSYAQAEIELKSKINKDQESRYSNSSLHLIHSKAILKRINQGDQLTILVPADYSVKTITNSESNEVFVKKNQNAIQSFVEKYLIEGLWDMEAVNSKLNSSVTSFSVQNRKNEKLTFSKNGDFLMISTANGYETNVENSIRVNNTVIHFLSGILK